MKFPLGKLMKGQTLVLFVIVAVLLIVDVFFIYALFSSKAEHEKLLKEINEIQTLGREYLTLKTSEEDLKKRVYASEETPTGMIDNLLGQVGLNDKIGSLKTLPERQMGQWKAISMELQLKDLSIEDLYRFLTMLKERREFFVRTMRIKKQFGSETLLQAVAEVFVIKERETTEKG